MVGSKVESKVEIDNIGLIVPYRGPIDERHVRLGEHDSVSEYSTSSGVV
jgi:hypothetical protein